MGSCGAQPTNVIWESSESDGRGVIPDEEEGVETRSRATTIRVWNINLRFNNWISNV